MFLLTWTRDRLSYQSLQDLDLAHLALAFTLCFLWLSRKRLAPLACMMGAAVYAFGGYICWQLQHFGLIAAYAWMPLGLWSIDEAAERQSWMPLWKLVLASALAFLGGYPSSWLVFAIAAVVYAAAGPWRWRAAMGTIAAIVFSLAVGAIQMLPTWDASRLIEPEIRYGGSADDLLFYLSYVVPNYFDFSSSTRSGQNSGKEYLYLGAPGILGVVLAVVSKKRQIIPAVALTLASLIFWSNPFDLVAKVVLQSALLASVARRYYFLAGIPLGLSELTAYGIDWFIGSGTKRAPIWMKPAVLISMGAWSAYSLVRWPTGFASGLASFVDVAIALAIFSCGLLVYRSMPVEHRTYMGVALIAFAGIDYKVFGTSRWFNAAEGNGPVFSATKFGGMNIDAYRALIAPSDYRISLYEFGPLPTDARHVGWNVAQGFEPFLSTNYRKLVTDTGEWLTDRMFLLDPLRLNVMELYGVRFVITGSPAPKYKDLMAHPRYRMVGLDDSFYKVFEYLDAKPIYQFNGDIEVQRRDPEHRTLKVSSAQGGLLSFAEQSYPGWRATLDGLPLAIEPWQIAFQAVRVPPGTHVVEFIYRERLLPLGAAISLVSLALLAWWIVADRKASSGSIYSRANPAVSV